MFRFCVPDLAERTLTQQVCPWTAGMRSNFLGRTRQMSLYQSIGPRQILIHPHRWGIHSTLFLLQDFDGHIEQPKHAVQLCCRVGLSTLR